MNSKWLLIFLIHASFCFSEPFVIGIAGASGSGKTTLASSLQQVLGEDRCAVMHADDYFKPLAEIKKSGTVDFDAPEAIDFDLMVSHLLSLKVGQSVLQPCYDFTVCDRVGEKWLEPKKIIIVEGFLLFLIPSLRNQFDLTVFLDADDDVLCLRRLERDLLVLHRPFTQVKQYYLNNVKPALKRFVAPSKQYAKLVIDANAPQAEIVDQLVGAIEQTSGF